MSVKRTKIEWMLVATLADAEARGTRPEDHIGAVASGLIDCHGTRLP